MKWYVVVRGLRPGIYRDPKRARAQVEGVSGSAMKSFATREEAEAYFEKAKAQGELRALDEEGSAYLARTDGGLKDGVGYAAAVLTTPEGRVAGSARLSFPKAKDVAEAELRGFLLALAMAPRGSRLRIETDRTDLPVFWDREAPDPWGLVPLLKALARGLGLEVEVRRVPRKKVEEAHANASWAREERERAKRDSARLAAFLERLPERYRMSALSLMERFLREGLPPSRFPEWLREGSSATRRLLLEALPKDPGPLLEAVSRLDGRARELLKSRDREKVWEGLPPTEKQTAFLKALGYEGPPPKTLKEASELIEALLVRRGSGGR